MLGRRRQTVIIVSLAADGQLAAGLQAVEAHGRFSFKTTGRSRRSASALRPGGMTAHDRWRPPRGIRDLPDNEYVL
jgi:hypothetical protein